MTAWQGDKGHCKAVESKDLAVYSAPNSNDVESVSCAESSTSSNVATEDIQTLYADKAYFYAGTSQITM
jgi:hypothetical protein